MIASSGLTNFINASGQRVCEIFDINVVVSLKGLQNGGDNNFKYPYQALCPVTNTTKTFNNINDVYDELLLCAKELEDKGIVDVAETLYIEHFMFSNTYELVDKNIQQRIKEYNFCKAFSVPPYPSLNETPAKVVDDFLEIEHIMLNIKKEKNVR